MAHTRQRVIPTQLAIEPVSVARAGPNPGLRSARIIACKRLTPRLPGHVKPELPGVNDVPGFSLTHDKADK